MQITAGVINKLNGLKYGNYRPSSRRRNEDSIKTWDERAKTFNEHEMCQRKVLLQAQTQERFGPVAER